ncbi:MAG: hypothetical protein AB1758_01845 [Candidatus Eremiobacterota bacterium]
MASRLEVEGKSIVMLGDFNPKIFQPAWLLSRDLVRQSEADQAEVQIIHAEVSSLEFEGYSIVVTRERFQISTSQAPFYPVIRDLVVGAFTLLSHTPIRALGLNTDGHFRMPSHEEWHGFGHRLTPKEGLWEGILKSPGMRSLTVEGIRPDLCPGYIRVKVEPSNLLIPGVFVSINDHLEPANAGVGCAPVVECLRQQWQEAQDRAQRILTTIVEDALKKS